jgi:hypothetical protein
VTLSTNHSIPSRDSGIVAELAVLDGMPVLVPAPGSSSATCNGRGSPCSRAAIATLIARLPPARAPSRR